MSKKPKTDFVVQIHADDQIAVERAHGNTDGHAEENPDPRRFRSRRRPRSVTNALMSMMPSIPKPATPDFSAMISPIAGEQDQRREAERRVEDPADHVRESATLILLSTCRSDKRRTEP